MAQNNDDEDKYNENDNYDYSSKYLSARVVCCACVVCFVVVHFK